MPFQTNGRPPTAGKIVTRTVPIGQADLLGKASSVYEKNILKLGTETQARNLERKEPGGLVCREAEPVGNSGERENLGQGPASAYGANHFHKIK